MVTEGNAIRYANYGIPKRVFHWNTVWKKNGCNDLFVFTGVTAVSNLFLCVYVIEYICDRVYM